MVRYLFYTIGDLTYQSPLVQAIFMWDGEDKKGISGNDNVYIYIYEYMCVCVHIHIYTYVK